MLCPRAAAIGENLQRKSRLPARLSPATSPRRHNACSRKFPTQRPGVRSQEFAKDRQSTLRLLSRETHLLDASTAGIQTRWWTLRS